MLKYLEAFYKMWSLRVDQMQCSSLVSAVATERSWHTLVMIFFLIHHGLAFRVARICRYKVVAVAAQNFSGAMKS